MADQQTENLNAKASEPARRAAAKAGENARRAVEDPGETVRAVNVEAELAVREILHAVDAAVETRSEAAEALAGSDLPAATETVERATDQFRNMFGLDPSDRRNQELALRSSRNLQAVADCNTAVVRGLQQISGVWLDLARSAVARSIDGANALAHCRTVQEVAAVQSRLLRDNVEQVIDSSHRLAQLAVGVTDEAARKIADADGAASRPAA